jgi:hypothetical protein
MASEPERCEWCGQALPEPTDADRYLEMAGLMVAGIILADLFTRSEDGEDDT